MDGGGAVVTTSSKFFRAWCRVTILMSLTAVLTLIGRSLTAAGYPHVGCILLLIFSAVVAWIVKDRIR